jgi:fluoride exporter
VIGAWWVFALAAAAGAVARYVVDRAVQSEVASPFPWGTLAVNVSGCLALGFLVGLARHHGVSDDVVRSVGTGGLGAYTTFSTVSVQVVRLGQEGDDPALALRYLSATMVIGAVAAALGVWVAGLV